MGLVEVIGQFPVGKKDWGNSVFAMRENGQYVDRHRRKENRFSPLVKA